MNDMFDPASRFEPELRVKAVDRPASRRRWGRAFAWGVFSIVGIASVVPGRIEFRTGAPPEMEHVLAYAVAGGVFAVVYGRKGVPLAAAVLIIGAVVFELAQNFVPERTPRVIDAACSITGSMIGLMVGLVLRRLWPALYSAKRSWEWPGRLSGFEFKRGRRLGPSTRPRP